MHQPKSENGYWIRGTTWTRGTTVKLIPIAICTWTVIYILGYIIQKGGSMDDEVNDHAMLRAADVARSRRTDDVRRRSKFHADMTNISTQTNNLGQKTETKLSHEWFLWKQTTLLCSMTFTLVLGTITQLKQAISSDGVQTNHSLLLCTLLCSLLLQCFVVLMLLTLTKNESDWLKDIRYGTAKIQRAINLIMAAIFVISILEIIEFVLIE